MFCILVHDHTLCFNGSSGCSICYYNYIFALPYYIVIHSTCCSEYGVYSMYCGKYGAYSTYCSKYGVYSTLL